MSPRPRVSSRAAEALLVVVSFSVACNAILGIEDYGDRQPDDGDGGTGARTGGSGGSKATGGSSNATGGAAGDETPGGDGMGASSTTGGSDDGGSGIGGSTGGSGAGKGGRATGGTAGSGGTTGGTSGAAGSGGGSGGSGGAGGGTSVNEWSLWPMPNPAGVAGVPNSASYTDRGDASVRDNVTGLIWQQTTSGALAWEAAAGYCEARGTGWRLPTIIELASLIDYTRDSPTIDLAMFPGTPSENFWSSSPMASDPTVVWFVGFQYGETSYIDRAGMGRVRCVR